MDWIRYRIEDAKATSATTLDLSLPWGQGGPEDRLRQLPPEILEMGWLEELDLSGHELEGLPATLGRLARLRTLNLSYNRGIRLGPELADLPSLERLDLSWSSECDTRSLPWGKLAALCHLDLQASDLEPDPALAALPALRSLHLDGTAPSWLADMGLEDLTVRSSPNWNHLPRGLVGLKVASLEGSLSGLSRFPHLQRLDLWDLSQDLSLAGLPDLEELSLAGYYGAAQKPVLHGMERLASMPRLRRLTLDNVTIDSIALAALWSLPLEDLSLYNIPLATVPDALCGNSTLRSLTLLNAGLAWIPDSLAGLEKLNLSGNPLGEVPPTILALRSLRSLNLAFCRIRRLPEEVDELSRLEELELFHNPLDTLPGRVANLPCLRFLGLGDTNITRLPEGLAGAPMLEQLDISETKITRLPEGLTRLRRLKPPDLKRVSLSDIPPEIQGRGWAAIQRYVAELEGDAAAGAAESRLYEAKLLLVGEGKVGKTSLARRLRDSKAVIADCEKTEGIVVDAWRVKTEKSDNFRINIWDFGGQEIYLATHQFFLTKRSLYLLVWEARTDGGGERFDYWLEAIRSLGDSSPVLVVMNKCDQHSAALAEKTLEQRYPNIRGFFPVSAETGVGMDDLREAIRKHIDGLDHVGTRWPAAWSAIRAEIEADPRDTMDSGQFLALCAHHGVEGGDAETLSGFLHDLGVILHFRDDPQLAHTVILKPEWGTDAVYRVLDTDAVIAAHGRFGPRDLAAIWDSARHPRDKHGDLVRLMARFELCFPVSGTKDHIAAGLLAKDPPPDLAWDAAAPALRFQYEYDFMPAGILPRFICRTHHLIEDESYWESGAVLTDGEGNRARVESLPRQVRIAIQGPEPRSMLAIIREHLGEIHRSLNDLKPRQMLPCRCPQCVGAASPYFFPYDVVKRARGQTPTLQCNVSFQPVAVAQLWGLLKNEGRVFVSFEALPEVVQAPPPPAITVKEKEKPLSPLHLLIAFVATFAAIAWISDKVGLATAITALGAASGAFFVTFAVYLFEKGKLKEPGFFRMLRMGIGQADKAKKEAKEEAGE